MRKTLSKRLGTGLIAFALVLSQVLLPVQSAYASHGGGGTNQPVWCQKVGYGWTAQIGGNNQNRYPLTELPDGHSNQLFIGQNGQVYAPNSSDQTLKGQLDQYCGQQYTLEIPAMPAVNDPCGPRNATWVKPADTDLIDWRLYTSGPLRGHLVAQIDEDGYVFSDGSYSYDFGVAPDSGELCDVEVQVPMLQTVDPCGLDNASWVVPANTDVYQYTLNSDGSVTLTVAKGYVLPGGGTTYEYGLPQDSGEYCVVEVPPAPAVNDECNVDGDNATWVVPSDDNMFSWMVDANGHLVVTALGDYSFAGNVKTHDYGVASDNGTKCTTPTDPTKSDTCGEKNDTYTIPTTEGIDYQIDGQTVAAGTYAAMSDVTINAVAQKDYELVGTNEWTLTFTNEYCEPEVNVYVYTYCDADGQTFMLRAHNPTDSDQVYEFVIRDSEGTIVEQGVSTLESGGYEYGNWTADTEDTYTFQVYSYNGDERGALLWETSVTTKCASDVFTPEIYKRDQFGNLLPGAKFTIEVCQWLPESEGWDCQTYYDVDLGSYTSGDWFSTIQYEKYVPTVVTVTETSTLPACTLVQQPWVFTWDYDYELMQDARMLVEMPKQTTPYNSGSWNVEDPWTLENECTVGKGGEKPPVETVSDPEVVPAQELPHTGPGGTVTTVVALLTALVAYGTVYFAQPKRQFED